MKSRNNFFKLLDASLTAAAAAALYALIIRPWHLRWGASDEELCRHFPGDKLIPYPKLKATHAVTIHASPAEIWPWIAQIGQGRGGFYSYDWIESLLGLNIHSSERIIPQLQNIKSGDKIPLGPDGLDFPIWMVEKEKALVLYGDTRTSKPLDPLVLTQGDFFTASWGFYLEKQPNGSTRLIERWRADWNDAAHNTLFYNVFLEPAGFIMERKMLLGIKERAEAPIRIS